MKKTIFLIMVITLVSGCGFVKKEKPVIKIGTIRVSLDEFNQALANFQAMQGQAADRKEFLDAFISRKLILKEAERLGLDRDPEFLNDIQLFWEQSLLKLMLSKKIKELSFAVKVGEKEIQNYYASHKENDFLNKELSEVYDQIKWILLNTQQKKAVDDWIRSLRQKTKIEIDYKAVGIK
jgi:hypothetical protein